MTIEAVRSESLASEIREYFLALGIEAAAALDDARALGELDEAAATLPRSLTTPLILAGRARLQAELAHRRGDADAAQRRLDEAIELLRSVGARPLLAQALMERARRSNDADALAEARSISEALGAVRWLQRIEQAAEVTA